MVVRMNRLAHRDGSVEPSVLAAVYPPTPLSDLQPEGHQLCACERQIGAIPLKQAVYALPDTPDCARGTLSGSRRRSKRRNRAASHASRVRVEPFTGLPMRLSWLRFTIEALFLPFNADNTPELEFETKLRVASRTADWRAVELAFRCRRHTQSQRTPERSSGLHPPAQSTV